MIKLSVEIPAHIRALKSEVNLGFSKGIQRVTAQMNFAAQQNAPYKTGTLRRSIHSEVSSLGGLSGKVIQDTGVAKYGYWVHDGTGIYGPKGEPIVPKTKKVLAWRGSNGMVFARSVKGMKPRPYMKKAFEEKKPEVPGIVKDSIMREVMGNGG